MGDMNAFVAESNAHVQHIMGKHGYGIRNDNGERFIDYCNANDLVVGRTMFPYKPWWEILKKQIDHYAFFRRFRDCRMDVRRKTRAKYSLYHFPKMVY